MDEYDLVCFQYSQCLRCLELDDCRNDTYTGYDGTNEFCDTGEAECDNSLCKCQKKLIQGKESDPNY